MKRDAQELAKIKEMEKAAAQGVPITIPQYSQQIENTQFEVAATNNHGQVSSNGYQQFNDNNNNNDDFDLFEAAGGNYSQTNSYAPPQTLSFQEAVPQSSQSQQFNNWQESNPFGDNGFGA